jgi:glucose/arabinose dehydrogenase
MILAAMLVFVPVIGCGQSVRPDPPKTESPVTTPHRADTGQLATFSPRRVPPTPERIRQLHVPPGFRIQVFARDLGNPRMMAVDADGRIYVTRPESGDVIALRDRDGDGQAEQRQVVISGLPGVHGLTLHQGRMYLATPRTVYVLDRLPDVRFDSPRVLVSNLPDGGNHPHRTLAFGPDGKLYVSIGSTCNACIEQSPESATLLRMNPDGSGREVFAGGLRNTIGFGWHPETGALWGMDIGSDWLGADLPPEELNELMAGGHYGWPWCYGARQVDPNMRPGLKNTTPPAFCAETQPAVMTYQAHSSPIGWVFYTGAQFPEAYRNDAFVAMRGSWNRKPAVGYKVVCVRFEGERPVRFEDFVTGFLLPDGESQFAGLAGIVVAGDGSLLVSDDQNGVIYRIAYAG